MPKNHKDPQSSIAIYDLIHVRRVITKMVLHHFLESAPKPDQRRTCQYETALVTQINLHVGKKKDPRNNNNVSERIVCTKYSYSFILHYYYSRLFAPPPWPTSIMPKKTHANRKDQQPIADIINNNVDDATAMLSNLSMVVPIEQTKLTTASTKEKKKKPAVFAERSVNNDPLVPVNEPSSVDAADKPAAAVATTSSITTVDDPPLDDDGQVMEVVSDEKQLEYLDQMFDEQAREKTNIKLPAGMKIRKDLLKTKLMPHQVQGVTWLIKQEMNADPHPLYKQMTSSNGTVRFRCSLTGRCKKDAPEPIKGGILADE